MSFDDFPYPFDRPVGQELLATLTRAFPSRPAATALAEAAGLDLSTIHTEQAAAYLWVDLLRSAAERGQTRAVVAQAAQRLPPTAPGRPLLDDLLAGRDPLLSGEPRRRDGSPVFLAGDDFVPEALLFHDDLTIGIDEVPALIDTLQRLVALAPAVCKLSVALPAGRRVGTGFRIGPGLLLTNWHVVHRAVQIKALFRYEVSARPVEIECLPVASSERDDWAVLSASPGDGWPVIPLDPAATPEPRQAAYIIQHPSGQPKRLAYVRNTVTHVDDAVVHYLTDTAAGSSGSPVFAADGTLIAVHHAGGRPQETLSAVPVVKNEGIRIAPIVRGLAAAGIQLGHDRGH